MVREEKRRSLTANAVLAAVAVLAVVVLYAGSNSFAPSTKASGVDSSRHSTGNHASEIITPAVIEQKSEALYATQGTVFSRLFC